MKNNNITTYQINKDDDMIKLIIEFKPDIVVITGHDAYYRKKGDAKDIKNYKNSLLDEL